MAGVPKSKYSHQRIDRINASDDSRLARQLRRNGRLLVLARRNLQRWMKHDGRNVRPVFQEWHNILTRLSRAEVAAFLRSDTAMARRLRQSSPFAGLFDVVKRPARRRAA